VRSGHGEDAAVYAYKLLLLGARQREVSERAGGGVAILPRHTTLDPLRLSWFALQAVKEVAGSLVRLILVEKLE
jgi:hypothetical protein